jgi:hypothetical protein
MAKERRRFEVTEKVKITWEHLLDKRPLPEVCEQYGIAPLRVSKEDMLGKQIKQLNKKLIRIDEVFAELVGHTIDSKKAWPGLKDGWGKSDAGQWHRQKIGLWVMHLRDIGNWIQQTGRHGFRLSTGGITFPLSKTISFFGNPPIHSPEEHKNLFRPLFNRSVASGSIGNHIKCVQRR